MSFCVKLSCRNLQNRVVAAALVVMMALFEQSIQIDMGIGWGRRERQTGRPRKRDACIHAVRTYIPKCANIHTHLCA